MDDCRAGHRQGSGRRANSCPSEEEMSVNKSVLRNIGVVGIAGVGAALLLAGGTGPALATTTAPPPAGASLITLGGPGDQTDPHVSGNLVAYTDFAGGNGQIVVHDLAT